MPAEALAEPPVAAAPEQAEKKEFTAAEFCLAFASINMAQREAVAEILNVPFGMLTPEYIGTHYDVPEHSMKVISKIEEVMNSGLCRDRIERFADNQPNGAMLRNKEALDFMTELSSVCFVGAASNYLLEKHRFFQSKSDRNLAKRRVIQAHEQLVKLVESEHKGYKIDRRHQLRFMTNTMFGKGDEPSGMPVWFEVGISTEIATKRGLGRLAAENERGLHVRYSDVDEDTRGADVVVTHGRYKLLIDVKSSDRSGVKSNNQMAFHSAIENAFDESPFTYRIKELYPAGIGTIGDNFSIDHEYAEELRRVLSEFEALVA